MKPCHELGLFRYLDSLPLSRLLLAALVALSVSVALYARLAGYERLLREPENHHGIVALELAFTPAQARAILAPWAQSGAPGCVCGGACSIVDCARASLYWDFLFIPAYVLSFALSITVLLRWFAIPPSSLCRLYMALAVAGLCDGVENLALLSSLPVVPAWGATLLAGVAASLKFLLLAGVLAILVAIVVDASVER